MQQYKVQRASEVSRHAFKNLVTLWLTIIFLTFAAALLIAAGSAKAAVVLPLSPPQIVYHPAILKVFSTSPAPAMIQERCHSHLHPQQHGINRSNFPGRTQRNAEPQSLQTVMAVEAYRQCVSQITLEQSTNKQT